MTVSNLSSKLSSERFRSNIPRRRDTSIVPMVMETTEALRAQNMGFPNPRKVMVLALIHFRLGLFWDFFGTFGFSLLEKGGAAYACLLASSSLRSDLLTITLDSIGVATKGFIRNCFYSLIQQACLIDPGYYLVNVAAHPNHQ